MHHKAEYKTTRPQQPTLIQVLQKREKMQETTHGELKYRGSNSLCCSGWCHGHRRHSSGYCAAQISNKRDWWRPWDQNHERNLSCSHKLPTVQQCNNTRSQVSLCVSLCDCVAVYVTVCVSVWLCGCVCDCVTVAVSQFRVCTLQGPALCGLTEWVYFGAPCRPR